MNDFDENPHVVMVSNFRVKDLLELLRKFNIRKSGQKKELKERVLELLRNKPSNLNYNAFVAKIAEINCQKENDYKCEKFNMRNMTHSQQQINQAPMQQLRRIHQPTQNAQQTMEITQTTSESNNSFAPLAQSWITVSMKKLPFFQVADDIVKPTVMIGPEKCTLPKAARGKSEKLKLFSF